MIYSVRKTIPSTSTKRPAIVVPHCSSNISTMSCAPTTKKQRFSSPSWTDLNGRLNIRTSSFNPCHISSEGPGGSSRINNIRIVSASSMHVTHNGCSDIIGEENISSMANYACSSNSDLRKESTVQPTVHSNLEVVNGSWSSSVTSLNCVHVAIESIRSTIGTDIQSQFVIADQCYYLAAWTKINTSGYTGNDTRPTSTRGCLTLHQVALSIVSHGGITVILKAMRAHPSRVEIQENGSMVLGNVLAILYRRKACSIPVFSYERYLGETTIQLGNSILNQLIQTMRNHPTNVEIHCATITALQHYYLSVLGFRPNDDATIECQNAVLKSAHEMLLPSKVRKILRTTTSLAEQFLMNCR